MGAEESVLAAYARGLKTWRPWRMRIWPSTTLRRAMVIFIFFAMYFVTHTLIMTRALLSKDDVQPHVWAERPVHATTSRSLTGSLSNVVQSVFGSSSSPTVISITASGKTCSCDLVSVDCLDAIRCLPQDLDGSHQLVAAGVLTRKLIKKAAKPNNHPFPIDDSRRPMGKILQYATIDAWKMWINENRLPRGLEGRKYVFINETLYRFCREHSLVGKKCFFKELNSEEDLDSLEMEALTRFPVHDMDAPLVHSVRQDVTQFLNTSRSDKKTSHLPALGNLLSFAHVLRMLFNRQETVREFYNSHFEPDSRFPTHGDEMRVGLHIRRADSCDHRRTGFESKPSDLFSLAQTSGKRMCYSTSVYLNELRRIKTLVGNRPIHVYLSTDDVGSILDEIKSKFRDLYDEMSWHYLNYSRNAFDYSTMIEDADTSSILGEIAVADLWHLSHSQVFIGHLGSRFGKIGWLLASARQNSFVPFSTVDGHSFCCEIDENCGAARPYIRSMRNCMTFAHDLCGKKINEDYWWVGSTLRKESALSTEEGISMTEDGLVLVHCKENTDFLEYAPRDWSLIVYETCGKMVSRTASVPFTNAGSGGWCAAYLDYIIENYDRLPETIVFLGAVQCSPFSRIAALTNATKHYMKKLGFLHFGDPSKSFGVHLEKDDGYLNHYMRETLSDIGVAFTNSTTILGRPGSCFAVRRERVLSRNKDIYATLKNKILQSNSDVARRRCSCLENSWHVLFGEELEILEESTVDSLYKRPTKKKSKGKKGEEKEEEGRDSI